MESKELNLDTLAEVDGGAKKVTLATCPYCGNHVNPRDLINHRSICKCNPKNQKKKGLFY